MSIWPFRRRRKRTSTKAPRSGLATEKQPAAAPSTREFQVLRKSSITRYPPSRRSSYRRRHATTDRRDSNNPLSYASSGVLVPDNPQQHPLSSDDDRDFTPQKQQHHSGAFASYFSEGESMRASLESLRDNSPPQQPAAPPQRSASGRVSGVIRKLSKRRKDNGPPNSIYNSHLGRHSSRSNRSPYGDQRPFSAASGAPRSSIHSIESQGSGGAFRIRSFTVLAPRPKLVYEEGSSLSWHQPRDFSPALVPSRTASRRTTSRGDAWRYKAPLASEENLARREDRIDDLVLELDDRELREAMERDQRRRERRQQEAEARAQRRLERRAQRQRLEESLTNPTGYASGVGNDHDHEMRDDIGQTSASPQTYDESPVDPHPIPDTGNQTPLSWFNDNPSAEQINNPQYYQPREELVTPISMDSQDYQTHEPSREHDQEATNFANHGPAAEATESLDPPVTASVPDSRAKASGWTSFIRKATAARIKKGQESRSIPAGQSLFLSDSDDEDAAASRRGRTFLEVEDLRHREGQTPGRHVSTEILTAMTALETGHIVRGNTNPNKEYEDELRDTLPNPPVAPYQQNDSQSSSRSSLDRHHSLKLANGNIRTTSQQSFNRPPSSQRYSPSLGRYGSGSPDGFRPRSVMSTSLASIDSEGSWLSGKINPRTSMPQISPLRASASSLRRRYNEYDDDAMITEDDFFAGVIPESPKPGSPDDDMGGARLDIDDSDEEGEDVDLIGSEQERGMWREGVEKKVSLEAPPAHLRAQSSMGMLNDEGSHETILAPETAEFTKEGSEGDGQSTQYRSEESVDNDNNNNGNNNSNTESEPSIETPINTLDSALQTPAEQYQTPMEEPPRRIPFERLGSAFQTPAEEYKTPMEEPMKRFPFERLGSAFQTPAEEYKTPLEEPIKTMGSIERYER